MRLPLVLGLGALMVAACGSSESESADVARSTAPAASTAPTTPVPTTPPDTSAPATTSLQNDDTLGAELVGRWAHYDVVAYEDDTLRTLIISFGFNDFTEVDGQIIDQGSFCFSEQRTDQPIETSLSDAATQAIRPPPTPVVVDVVDGVLSVQRPASPTAVGIRLDDPANEPIRVTDDITGELYIARREIFAYDAMLTEPDVLTGTVTDDSEQLVIGASDPIFASSPANWGQYPDLSKSPIILQRVDADWDCERLATERDALFPPTPEVDW